LSSAITVAKYHVPDIINKNHIYYNVGSLIVYYWLPLTTMDAILATIVASGGALV
jgi:hypothetical protein